jgi:hypothetical protein
MEARAFIIISVLTIIISFPRFADHTPDSHHYIDLGKYFKGELPKEKLVAPFAYRIMVPFIAANLPSDNLGFNIAIINVVATIIAYLLFFFYLRNFLLSREELIMGMLLLIFSFPTFSYSSRVLSDPAGFLMFLICCYLILKECYYLLSLSICLGIIARESNITLVLIVLIYIILNNEKSWKELIKTSIITSIPPIITFYLIRLYFYDLPSTFPWDISLKILIENITRPISIATVFLCIFPPLLLFLIGIKFDGFDSLRKSNKEHLNLFIAITVVNSICFIYTILNVYMSGRYVWPIYTALIPLAVISSKNIFLVKRFLFSLSNLLMGTEETRHL